MNRIFLRVFCLLSRLRFASARLAVVLTEAAFVFCLGTFAFAEPFAVSHFDKRTNELGGRSSIYQQAPSKALATLSSEVSQDAGGKSLKLVYDKKGNGGPYGKGGWCGFYTRLESEGKYFNGSSYKTLSFWVKGETGGENFRIGLSDKHWDEVGDSVKSEPIETYLPAGKVTAEWQRASIPLDVFFLDYAELAAIAICFEGDVFPSGEGAGAVYIDEMVLE
ncbi:MAG: hypothetical protein ABH845_02715 [Candidatus Omnitrophota bacterium]